MQAYQQEILENTICYIATEYKKFAKKPLYKTMLFKILAIYDFKVLKIEGRPALDIDYIALPKGPVPKQLYANINKIKSSKFEIKDAVINNRKVHKVIPKSAPDMDYLSEDQIDVLKTVIQKLSHPFITSAHAIAYSHKEITAWKKAFEKGERDIKYGDTFNDLLDKRPEELTYVEERFLNYIDVKSV